MFSRTAGPSIPTFALVDVLRCADRAPDAIAAAFSGKIVLVGGTLAEEDRRVSSGRFLERPKEGPMLAPCGLHHLGASNANSDTVSGIFLHGAAIEAVAAARITSTLSSVQLRGPDLMSAVITSRGSPR